MPVFVTSDGYRLRLEGDVWTDGDLSFERCDCGKCNGGPVDIAGPLVGYYAQEVN